MLNARVSFTKQFKLSVLYEAYEIWCKQYYKGCANAKRDFKIVEEFEDEVG